MKKSWMCVAILAFSVALVLCAGTAGAGIIVSQGANSGSNLYTLLGLTGDSQDLCVKNAVAGTTINNTNGELEGSGYREIYVTDGRFDTRSFDKVYNDSPNNKVVYVVALKDRYIVNRIGFAAESVGQSTQLYVIDDLGGATVNNYAVDLATDGVAPNATLADSESITGVKGANIAYLGSASLGLKGTHVAFVSAGLDDWSGDFVSIYEIAAAGTGFADAGGPYVMSPWGTLDLDASGSTYANTSLWNLDNDTNFDDASGVAPTISYSYLVNTLGLATGKELTIGLQVNGDTGTHTAYTTLFINAPVAEPTSLGLLGLALLGLRNRRK
jgi:hypothetical protein